MKLIPVWHGHHNVLISWIESIRKRKDEIRKYKPIDEQPLRLKVIKLVKGKLPPGVVKAWEAFGEAREVCKKVLTPKTREAYNEARIAYCEVLKKYKKEIEALHAKECPGCPWNGKTIFPKEHNP